MTSISQGAAKLSPGEGGAARKSAAPRQEKAVAVWLFLCCALIYLLLLLGGITRLTQSGLSITDWDPIIGVVPPLSHAAWERAFSQYKAIAQYRLIHEGMTLAGFKVIFFWEYAHRLLARLVGFVYAAPLVYFLLRGRLSRRLLPPLLVILLLGFGQGVLGWYMVESGLQGRAEVSQYRLAAHLGLALLIYSAILWLALSLARAPSAPFDGVRMWRRAAAAVLALLSVTILAGAFVAGLHAGLIDNSFPLMGGRLVPPDYGTLHPFLRNLFANPAAAQFDHRLLALLSAAAVLSLWGKGLLSPLPQRVRRALHALLAAVLIQVGLGISTLLLVVPLPLAVLHQAGAVAVLTAAIVLCHALSSPSRAGAAEMDACLPRAL